MSTSYLGSAHTIELSQLEHLGFEKISANHYELEITPYFRFVAKRFVENAPFVILLMHNQTGDGIALQHLEAFWVIQLIKAVTNQEMLIPVAYENQVPISAEQQSKVGHTGSRISNLLQLAPVQVANMVKDHVMVSRVPINENGDLLYKFRVVVLEKKRRHNDQVHIPRKQPDQGGQIGDPEAHA